MSSLPIDAHRSAVAVCAGKDCRSRCESAKVRSILDGRCEVIEMKCVGLCKGPVVVVDADSASPVVYSKVRSKRHRRLLAGAIAGDQGARDGLAGLQVVKKSTRRAVARRLRVRALP